MSKLHRKNQQLAKELTKRKKTKTEDTAGVKVVDTPTPQSPKRRGRKRKNPVQVKPKKRYGKIVSVASGGIYSMDYLIGRDVKILPHSTDTILYCVIQHPGYDGLEMAFEPSEIQIIEKVKKREESSFF